MTFLVPSFLFLAIFGVLSDASVEPKRCDEEDFLCKGVVLDLLHGIRIITVSGRNLTQLPPGSLRQLTNFTRVDLSNNSIPEIKNGVFTNMGFVTVDLAFNQICLIESDAFAGMTELRYLRLDFNKIAAWDSAWFKTNRNLHQISFSNNLIEEVPSRAFQAVKWVHNYDIFVRIVTVVDLSNNRIRSFYSDIFGEETEIGRVNFANNSIVSVPREVFSGVEYVEELDLSHNKLDCDTVFYLLNLGKIDSVNMKYQDVNSIV